MPFIGLTTYAANTDRRFTLPREYLDAVRRAGGCPLLLAPGETHFDGLLDTLDGLILSGGGDVAPQRYGGKSQATIYGVDEERDEFEMELVRRALQRELPLLAICRGMQLLNVALGGTLIEHLPDEVGERILHRAPPHHPIEHVVHVEAGCRLAEWMVPGRLPISSWHHQGLRKVAEPLRVVARADDGVTEAVEAPDHPWCLGVQWHPEITAAADPVQQSLFRSFVLAADQLRKHR
jgi:putative glutamine amidotransferase